ncbi:MAG: hypothetical protein E6J25_02720 [Chloroflexi bacterium]|nr:MAG: hypothetical protein E6J25_02720 [Chloroflexota bacterium]
MSKESALAELAGSLEDPAIEKDGNLLAESLRQRARRLLQSDRSGLTAALRQWLEVRDDVLSIQSAILIGDLRLSELRSALHQVRNEVAAGRALRPTSLWLFDTAIATLASPNELDQGGP